MISHGVQDCPNHDIRLDQLAEAMAKSSWQCNELSEIKNKLGYKICRTIYGILDKILCGNLYAYVANQGHRRASTIYRDDWRDENDTRVTCRLPKCRFKAPTCGHLDDLLRAPDSLDDANDRIFGWKRKFTFATLLSRVLLAHCLSCTIGLTFSIYYQYNYDYYLFHLERLNTSQLFGADQTAATTTTTTTSNDRARQTLEVQRKQLAYGLTYEQALITEQKLLLKVQEAKVLTKTFGSFLLNRPFFSESAYVLMIILCLLTYSGPMLYYRLRGRLDFHYLRLILDWDQEQLNCNRMIEELVQQVAMSSKNFMLIAQDNLFLHSLDLKSKAGDLNLMARSSVARRHDRDDDWLDLGEPTAGSKLQMSSLAASPRFRFHKMAAMAEMSEVSDAMLGNNFDLVFKHRLCSEEHDWLVRKLKWLALTGHLQPLDRSNVKEMSRNMLFYSLFVSWAISSCYIWNIILFTFMPQTFNFNYETDFMDCVTMLELGTLNVLLTIGGVFYLSLTLIYCHEQVAVMRKLRRKITRFIQTNSHILASKAQGGALILAQVKGASVERSLYDPINTELVLILLQYRTFAAQVRPARKSLGFVLLCSLSMMVIFPIIARLHMPYLHDRESQILTIVVCFIMIGLSDTSVVPICWMNSRCLDLYHSLSSLMALVVGLSDHSTLGSLLNEHTIWLLRKELSHPERLAGQYAIATMGVEFTYSELLKLHFWLGLVVLSFSHELSSSANPNNLGAASQERQARDSMMLGGMFSNMLTDPLGIISSFKL